MMRHYNPTERPETVFGGRAIVSGVSALHECKRSLEGRTMTETDMASVHKFAAHALRQLPRGRDYVCRILGRV